MSDKYYSDLNLSFQPHPLTGDITFLSNEQAVKRSLMTIANTLPYDVPFKPDLHGQIRELLFEMPSPVVAATLKTRITCAFNKLEPRAKIEDIDIQVSNDETGYAVRVKFSVISLLNQQEIQFFIGRIR